MTELKEATMDEVSAAATGAAKSDKARERALSEVRSDLRIALRNVQSAIEAESAGDASIYVVSAEQRVALALSALRAAKG